MSEDIYFIIGLLIFSAAFMYVGTRFVSKYYVKKPDHEGNKILKDHKGDLVLNQYAINIVDAILIILVNEKIKSDQALQYKLLNCGFVVVLPDVKVLLNYMRQRDLIEKLPTDLTIN